MTIGGAVRRILGPKLFARVGKAYRSVFVDLEKVASAIEPYIPENAYVIDIGGGDGEPLNHLLALRTDIQVDMIDLSPNLGGMLRSEYLNRVRKYPGVSIDEFNKQGCSPPDCVLISDVIHHVPTDQRAEFFADLMGLIGAAATTIIIKDVEPGYLRSALGYCADRFISGDKNVCLISQNELEQQLVDCAPAMKCTKTSLMSTDCPNYALVFKRNDPKA